LEEDATKDFHSYSEVNLWLQSFKGQADSIGAATLETFRLKPIIILKILGPSIILSLLSLCSLSVEQQSLEDNIFVYSMVY
jgi:hypothetical protein